jgi:hypothetical protein
MNAAERVVECYFRYCRGCLTIPDVKIKGGNNRQIDLLAWNQKQKIAFHVESSVTLSGKYFNKSSSWKHPFTIFQNKFFGQPKALQNHSHIPHINDKEYAKVKSTYTTYGFDAAETRRVWVCWNLLDYKVSKSELENYFHLRSVEKHLFEVISFRDEIIPKLQKEIGSSNYEDDVLRTFSFFAERDDQIGAEKLRKI